MQLAQYAKLCCFFSSSLNLIDLNVQISTYPLIPGTNHREGDPICDRFECRVYDNRAVLSVAGRLREKKKKTTSVSRILSFSFLFRSVNFGTNYIIIHYLKRACVFIFSFIGCAFLIDVYTDGCNWGSRPRDAATKATEGFCAYLESRFGTMHDIQVTFVVHIVVACNKSPL